jgi:hypothetical protein
VQAPRHRVQQRNVYEHCSRGTVCNRGIPPPKLPTECSQLCQGVISHGVETLMGEAAGSTICCNINELACPRLPGWPSAVATTLAGMRLPGQGTWDGQGPGARPTKDPARCKGPGVVQQL